MDEYERIYEILELFEYTQIHDVVEKRKTTPLKEYISMDQLLAEQGIVREMKYKIVEEKSLVQIVAIDKRDSMKVYKKVASRNKDL